MRYSFIEYACECGIQSMAYGIPMLSQHLISSFGCLMDNVCWMSRKERLSFFLHYILINLCQISIISNPLENEFALSNWLKTRSCLFLVGYTERLRPCLHHILSIYQQYPVVVYYYDYDYYYSNLSCVREMYKQTTKLMTIRRAVYSGEERKER